MSLPKGQTSSLRMRFGILAFLALGVAACDTEDDGVKIVNRPERVVTRTEWDTVFVRGVTSDDTTFGIVSKIAASDGQLFILDTGHKRLVALDSIGNLRWIFGGAGRGPGEFRRAVDFDLLPSGNVAVLDVDNSRISIVDGGGTLVSELSLRGRTVLAEQLVAFEDGGFLLWMYRIPMRDEDPFAEVSAGGRIGVRAQFPWDEFDDIHPMAAQGKLAHAAGSRFWTWAFLFGDRWVGVRSGNKLVTGLYPDSVAWPTVTEEGNARSGRADFTDDPIRTGVAIHVSAQVVSILSKSPVTENYFLDRYNHDTGEYLESWSLPGGSSRFAIIGETLYFGVTEPFPGIVAIRPHPMASAILSD